MSSIPRIFPSISIRALAYALSFSQKFQACLTVLHVVRGAPDNPEREQMQPFFTDQLQQLALRETTFKCQQQFRIEFGDPTSGILRCADSSKADLIVMGVRGTGAMVRASTHFGSTAYRVISEARAPVFSVRGERQDALR